MPDFNLPIWEEMTYDEQRAFLGLPDVRTQLAWDRLRLGLNDITEGFNKLGESMRSTLNAMNAAVSQKEES